MTSCRETGCSDDWSECYERLRQHALGETAAGGCFGLETLLQNGMAAWMQVAPADVMERDGTPGPTPAGSRLAASPWETTVLLAEMTWPQIFPFKRKELNAR